MARRTSISLVILCLAFTRLAVGQDIVGSIEGTASDPSGAVLPGVTISVTSPALIGGAKTGVTDADGRYSIRLLPPGVYDVKAELSGFAGAVRRGLELRVGQTMTVNFPLTVATVAETVEVTSDAPVIDLRHTVREYTVDAKAIAKIPLTTNQRYGDLFSLAPGVRDNLDAPGQNLNFIVNGASATQNKVFIDGIDAMDHVNASMVTNINSAIIQEVSISTGGMEAESGFGSGGYMTIVTRSGGNQLSGGASIYLTPKRFNGTNQQGIAPADLETYYPEVHVGGPIVRDRLWFFGSEKYLIQNQGFTGVSDFRKEVRGHEAYGKVTHQVASQHRFAYIFQWDRRRSKNDFATTIFAEDASSIAKFGGYLAGVNWDYQVGPRSVLQFVGSYFSKPGSTDGRNGDSPRRIYQNSAGTVLRFEDNYDRDLTNESTRWYFSAKYARSLDFGGSHDVQLSSELYPRTRRLNRQRLNVLETYRDSVVYGPRQLLSIQTPRPLEGTDNDGIDRAYGIAIQDSWRAMRRLTVNGGIRYEHNHTTLVGLDEALVEFGSWSPRLGVAFEINEKTVVKTSVSRLGEKFALDFLFTFFPNPIVYDTATSSLGNGVLDVFTQGAAPLTTTRNVDRRVPSALEFVTSLARQLPWGIAADVSYVRRRYKGFTDSIDRNLILDIPNKRFVGRVNPAFDALTDVVTNARQQRLYNSLQFWINRRLANRWQVDAAYTYAIDRQDGEFGFGTTALAALQFAYGDRARDFYGVTSGPRHTLKLAGSYTLPWDVTAGVYYSKKSPTVLLDQYQVLPATALPPRVTLSNGRIVNDPLFNPLLLVAPPDEEVGRKIGGQHLLSLQLEKSFLIGRHTLRVMALGYNLPNASRALNYLSSTIGNTNYGRFSSIQPPRAGQLSFGWEF